MRTTTVTSERVKTSDNDDVAHNARMTTGTWAIGRVRPLREVSALETSDSVVVGLEHEQTTGTGMERE